MSLEREIRKIMAKAVFENFVNNPDCDICGDGSPCTCGESQEIDEALDADDTPQIKKIVKKLKGASKAHADQAKSLEKELSDDKKVMCPKCKGEGCEHCDNKGYHMSEDIRNLPRDKQRALQHADKTAKPKSKVSLAPTPGIKTEISFRPNDDTSLGKRYADKVGRGDYSKDKTDNRKKGIATMTYKRAAQKGVPNTAKVPFSESNLDEAFEEFFAEAKGMKVFFVSGSNAEGNVHAKNEKEALAIAKKKGIKGKITIRDKGKAVQPKFVESVNEGYEGEVKKVLDKKGIDAYFKNGKLMVSKRDKAMVIQILKRQDFDMPNIQVEEIQMESNRFGLSVSLVDAVADVLAGRRPVEEKKKMDPVGQEDGDIDNDGDKDSSDEYLMKKRKAIGKAMKKDGGGKEPVDTKPKMDEAKLAELDKDTLRSYIDKKKADIKRRDANTVTGRGKAVGDGGKDRYGVADNPKVDADKQRARDKSNVKLAKAKIAYKDADKTHAGRSSPDKKGLSGPGYKFQGKGLKNVPPRNQVEDMTDAQMKRREEIVKELKKKSADFEERYGDKADAVMYATATKMAMKGK